VDNERARERDRLRVAVGVVLVVGGIVAISLARA